MRLQVTASLLGCSDAQAGSWSHVKQGLTSAACENTVDVIVCTMKLSALPYWM